MGGMNVLESEETALLVAEKFKEVTDKLKINWILKPPLIKQIEVQLNPLEVQVWMRDSKYLKKFHQHLMFQ